ncbi:hypothetical protein IAT38_000293 [Cryptococcus sp. DSM 104549]
MSYQNGYGGPPSGFGGGYNNGGGGGNRGWGRGGGGPRRGNDHRGGGRGRGGYGGGRPPPPPESSDNRLKKMVVKFGDDEDFDPIDDPHRLARALRRSWDEGSAGILEGFRISVTQQPQKHSYYATLLVFLSERRPAPDAPTDAVTKPEGEAEGKEEAPKTEPQYGKEILDDLNRAFRGWVESREWQNVRICLQFFSSLLPVKLVSAASLFSVYEALLAVLDEVGGGGDRAERAVRAVGEGLIRSGASLYAADPDHADLLISKIQGYIIGRPNEPKVLADPLAVIITTDDVESRHSDSLDDLLSALYELQAAKWETTKVLPNLEKVIPPADLLYEPYELAEPSMPPEMYEVDQGAVDVEEGKIGSLRLFADDVVPPPTTVDGWVLRSLVLDIINIYEVNRKECARILLELRGNFSRGTFKPSSQPADAPPPTSTWSLESLVISTLLSSMLTLPRSHHKLIYYSSVITELCKSSPNTVAPPVGRSVRKIFALLGSDGLDVEIAERVATWFAVHLSNFGFQWMWKEWVPELELPGTHPRRAFMRRMVELEVRLAYHDRILETLPEPMTQEGAGVISPEAPDPFWAYEKEDHPLHAEAAGLLALLRQKLPPTEIISHLNQLPNASSGPGEPIFPAVRIMVFETLLHLGSRSFSHFLNATERYLDVIRFLAPDRASRRSLLDAVKSYWRRSSEMRLVAIDKYLQYGVLEGLDVVEFTFTDNDDEEEEGDGWTDGDRWELLKMCLEKHIGRVKAIRARLRAIEKEDEAARARQAAAKLEKGGDVGDEADAEDIAEDAPQPENSREAREAQAALDTQTARLEKVLVATTKHFVSSLLPWCFEDDKEAGIDISATSGLKSVLTLLDSGEEALWGVRAKWGWYREYLRRYQFHLVPLANSIDDAVFSALPKDEGEPASEARAERMVKGVWDAVRA